MRDIEEQRDIESYLMGHTLHSGKMEGKHLQQNKKLYNVQRLIRVMRKGKCYPWEVVKRGP